MPLIEFSAERPFGIELYPIFDKGFQLVTGKPTSEWAFTQGVTPLSTYKEGNIYLKIIFNLFILWIYIYIFHFFLFLLLTILLP